MSDEQPRTDANSRERSPDHQYTLSIEQAAELYAKAGHPRTPRAIQKYCALSKLDCHKVETETGEKYLVAPYSVDRHITYINEVRTVANGRDQTRTDANVRTMENKGELSAGTNSPEQPRTDAAVRGPEDRYVVLLERENEFLRGQVSVKDTQIEALLERDKETNTLIHRLQAMLAPLLVAPGERRDPTRGRLSGRIIAPSHDRPPRHRPNRRATAQRSPRRLKPSKIRDVFFPAANSRERTRTFARNTAARLSTACQHVCIALDRAFAFAGYNNQTYDGNR